MVGGGPNTTDARTRVGRGRPNWWVILAVSLALMALLVATAHGNVRRTPRRHRALASAAASASHPPADGAHRAQGASSPRHAPSAPPTSSTTTSTTTSAPHGGTNGSGTSLLATQSGGTQTPASAPVTTTTVAPTTTTTVASAVPAARGAKTYEGYLVPPGTASNQFDFTGTGAMQISVLWSGSTYLTMVVSCPNGSQNVGGTSAMQASLPDAAGSCQAVVSEPAPGTASVSYTITIGPGSG